MNTKLKGCLGGAAAAAAGLVIALTWPAGPPRAGHRTPALPLERTGAAPATMAQDSRAPRSIHMPAAGESEPPASSLAARVERLAQRDTPVDAFAAFALLARCVRATEFDHYLKSMPMDRGLGMQRTVYGDGRHLLRAACGDLTLAQLAARIDLVDKAARGGVAGAASAWIEQGPFGDKSALAQRPDDPLVVEWVQQAIAWVKSAAKRDDIEAIMQFGMLCLNWELEDTERVSVLVQSATQRDIDDQLRRLVRHDAPRTEARDRTPP